MKQTKPKSIYNKNKFIHISFDGKLKEEIIKRSCNAGFNNEPSGWLRYYLKKKWRIKKE